MERQTIQEIDTTKALSLLELNRLIGKLMTVEATQNVWITAELSDVAVRGGHCYMELLQKDDNGQQLAKARAVIWASTFSRLASNFESVTGQRFQTGLKVMMRVSANMHPVYGMSLVVSAINPQFTMGDLLRRRREILARLTAEGVINLNRELEWPDFAGRIAVISAAGAAGYGDFMNQLYSNPMRLRFQTRLFPAIMQGEKSPSSIISQLEYIADESEQWDCVVIIRGGGATSDLQAYEDYELASAVAQFPLPVIIGIGHERDVTVLDYVANMRVKTPTAAAEWLINRGETLMNGLNNKARNILQAVSDMLSGAKEHLGYCCGLLPVVTTGRLEKATMKLRNSSAQLGEVSSRRIFPALERLRLIGESLQPTAQNALRRAGENLRGREQLLNALSPQTVLSRGYSITRLNGKAIISPSEVKAGDVIETTVAQGTIKSEVK